MASEGSFDWGGWLRLLCKGRPFASTRAAMESMDEVAVHGANKIPRAPSWYVCYDPVGVFVRNIVLGELTLQWGRLSITSIRHRQHILDIQWRDAGAFQVWFEGWFLLVAPRRLELLSRTWKYDRPFCNAMVQAVYGCPSVCLDNMD